MSNSSPVILWLRRDLRLSDHPALDAACKTGRPVIPLYIHDDQSQALGAAPKFRIGLALDCLAETLRDRDSRLILRRGEDALAVLRDVIKETGAGAVYWSRLYDPAARDRDSKIKEALKHDEIEAQSFAGHLMFEPWTVETKTGDYYKVFTPFWKSVRSRDVAEPLSAPDKIPAPDNWPESDNLADWKMDAEMQRGRDVVRPHARVGETAAQSRLGAFVADIIEGYDDSRDRPGEDGTSAMSEHLTYGEITPMQCWHAAQRALQEGEKGAETFLKELAWREFAYHLMYHTPRIVDKNWREKWDTFPWNEDARRAEVKAWKQARTGVPFVDAAMRELQVTGRMHNRGRMIVASYLTKHLMCHWRIGQQWFEEHLIDWDPANNAMGWQWAAGSGPDATPFFRIFNPETQLDRFDPDRAYTRRWIAEGQENPSEEALAYFEAIPKRWKMSPDDDYPEPIVALDEGRERALDAYRNRDF